MFVPALLLLLGLAATGGAEEDDCEGTLEGFGDFEGRDEGDELDDSDCDSDGLGDPYPPE